MGATSSWHIRQRAQLDLWSWYVIFDLDMWPLTLTFGGIGAICPSIKIVRQGAPLDILTFDIFAFSFNVVTLTFLRRNSSAPCQWRNDRILTYYSRSNAQLKRELNERRQRNRESVKEFSRALLEISEGICDKMQSKNEMLVEVFCQNLVDIHIKREMKRLVRSQTTISFSALKWRKTLRTASGSETATTMEPPTHLSWPIVQNNDRSHEWRQSKQVVASKFHEEGSIRGITWSDGTSRHG